MAVCTDTIAVCIGFIYIAVYIEIMAVCTDTIAVFIEIDYSSMDGD